jgi:hypothetical protein
MLHTYNVHTHNCIHKAIEFLNISNVTSDTQLYWANITEKHFSKLHIQQLQEVKFKPV